MKDITLSRRQFLKILGLTTAGAAAYQIGIRPQMAGLAEVSISRMLMGTVLNLTVVGEDEVEARRAVQAALDHMSQLESILSRHQAGSQLSLLNTDGRLAHPSPHLLAVLRQAQQISAHSSGTFDITVKPLVDLFQMHQTRGELPTEAAIAAVLPLVDYQKISISNQQVAFDNPGMAVTFDGIGKGYIVDQGTETLRAYGFENVLVEAGGDLLAAGKSKIETPWQIGIHAPRSSGPKLLAKFGIENKAVATSGDYMQPYSADYRCHHILDPRSGYSAPDLASATVLAPSAMLADGLATAVMAMSDQHAIALLEGFRGCEGYLVAKAGDVVRTTGFPGTYASSGKLS